MNALMKLIEPYLKLAMFAAIMIASILIVLHLLVYGVILAAALFLFLQCKQWLYPATVKPIVKPTQQGRIFEHEPQ